MDADVLFGLLLQKSMRIRLNFVKQASPNPDFTSGLTLAGARLKKVMKKRFKVVDGVEFFEVHSGEWVKSDSSPVGPCKSCRQHGLIERHWVWMCPRLK